MLASLKRYIQALRAPFFTASVIPVCFGLALAYRDGCPFDFSLAALSVIGIVLIHAGANLANDYFDHVHGVDAINVDYVLGFSGGSRLIQEGLISPSWFIKAAIFCLAVGSLVGLYIVYRVGLVILWIGLFGVGTAFFYSADPLKLSHKGLGEVIIALDFGVLPVTGAYAVLSGRIAWEPILASLPLALLIANVLIVNSIPDAPADRASGKLNIAARVGRLATAKLAGALYLLAFAGIVLLCVSGVLPRAALIALAGFPIAVMTCRNAIHAIREGKRGSEMRPACVGCVTTHLITGFLLTVGVLAGGLFT